MEYVVYGITDEILNYTQAFWNKISFVITDLEETNIKMLREKEVKTLDWLSGGVMDNAFIVVSNIVNKQKAFGKLEAYGYLKNIDYVWGPEWFGDENLPSCYEIKSWEQNEREHAYFRQKGLWDYRYRELLTFLSSECKSVMDCGAGNMSLKRMLDPEIEYYPVDNVQRYPETIVCDFNKNEFPDIYVDAVFACGILEYIAVTETFIKNMCAHCKMVLLSYCTLNVASGISERLALGWKNHFTEGEIVKMFFSNNFELKEEVFVEKDGIYLVFCSVKDKTDDIFLES